MNLGKLLKRIFNPRPVENYVSDVDMFLEKFDAENAEDQYATQERQKHERIAKFRDTAIDADEKNKLWEEF